jgi:hypothetical protein
MSKLEVLKAELDAIEAAEQWDHPAHQWLSEQVEELEREEAAKPPAPTPAPAQQASDTVAALEIEMQAALANPERYSDAQRDQLVTRYNTAVMAAGQSQQTETVDLGALTRDMLTAGADPSKLSDEQRTELLRRYDKATRQRPDARVDSPDLAERMEAARQAQERGEDVDVDALMAQFEHWQSQQLAASRDPANFPPELQEAAKVLYAAEDAMHRPADPVDAAIGDLNRYVRGMKPPTLEEQLEAAGVQVELEPAGEGQGDG